MEEKVEEEEWIESPAGWGDNNFSTAETGENNDSDEDEENNNLDLFADNDPHQNFRFPVERDGYLVKTISLSGFKLDSSETAKSTGVTLWQAAPTISKFISNHASKFISKKKVLELGAGLGLPGIVAHHLGAEKVFLTDADTNTLKEMRKNVKNNCADVKNVYCHQLQWNNPQPFREKFGLFDTILAADVIYVPESVELLFDAVATLLKPDGRFLLCWLTRWNNVPEPLVKGAAQARGLSVDEPGQGILIFQRDPGQDWGCEDSNEFIKKYSTKGYKPSV